MKILAAFITLIFSSSLILNPAQVEKPEMISKEDWGGKEMLNEVDEHEITWITIHHSGVEFPEDKDPYQYMRDLQVFSQDEKKWVDIPYHYTIDLKGKIFENRPLNYPGDTNTEYDPAGHALINVVGNYEIQKIKPAQIDAIVHLSAWLAQEHDVPVDSIASHKDHSNETVCPGKDLYKYFEDGTIKREIESLLTNNRHLKFTPRF